MEGSLSKWTNVMKGWQYRWFVLDEAAGLFSYYTSRDKMVRGVRRGCVRLRGAVIGIDDEDEATFTITVDGKTFHFQAKDSEERERWIRALEDTVVRHNQVRRVTSRKLTTSGSAASIEDFEKKLSETDSYLEMLVAQVANIKNKSEDQNAVAEVKDTFETVVKKAQDMTESIKHAIVLLQIAKNAALPAESTTGTVKDFSHLSPVHRPTSVSTSGQDQLPDKTDTEIEQATECGEETMDEATKSAQATLSVVAPPSTAAPVSTAAVFLKPDKRNPIPECSYSSSDDDDDFFDAEDEEKDAVPDRAVAAAALTLPLTGIGAIPESPVEIAIQSPLTPSDKEIDFDALYEEDKEESDVDMKSHGSVITHLLSQVRIGMDLTKIVLPTFILERRSLLEMYSDFFAHPDLFVSIAEGNSPEERMIRVLRWYLSSFHAGRKSSIAKKPYNPILGETFRCHWDALDNEPKGNLVKDGPLPWCHQNELTFVAEQVSHHPPISAFYAEHPQKRITVNAHIYTKSSFLGMSVAVHNVGQGKLTLLDHDEEYICTFPSGYGRSILTVPWIELGGKVTITCPKTNYLANVEFKCKQFFSSEVNKISAEVISPMSKKPIVKVDGEWNGRMMAKWASGKNEVFFDVTKSKVHSKICKQIRDQARFESRRLWKDVTYGLKTGNIELATAAKTALEQRQREEAAQRKEQNAKWETKLFQPIGENWQFMSPLEKRSDSKSPK